MRNTIRLPQKFALAVDPFLHFVYRIEKTLLDELEFRDVSKLYGEYAEHGDIRVEDSHPPLFSTEILVCNGRQIEIEFCITPLFFVSTNRRPYPVVIIKNFAHIQRVLRTHPSNIRRILPPASEWRAHDVLRFLFEEIERANNSEFYNRRWPNGLRPYPEQYNFDIDFHNPSRRRSYSYDNDFDSRTPSPPVRRVERPRTQTPAPTSQTPATKPKEPSERVALALARDSIAQGEICPITQDKLQPTKIGVTGCMCVFQGEAIESYTGTTCPSCRTPLTVRYVTLSDGKSKETPVDSGTSNGTETNSLSNE